MNFRLFFDYRGLHQGGVLLARGPPLSDPSTDRQARPGDAGDGPQTLLQAVVAAESPDVEQVQAAGGSARLSPVHDLASGGQLFSSSDAHFYLEKIFFFGFVTCSFFKK